jgi:hypothetical protein
MANPRLHLWAVDPFMVAFTEKTTRYFLRQFIKEGRCEVIPKYTPAAAEQLAHLKDRLDYVFIDGGHAYENVLEDIACWQPFGATWRHFVRPRLCDGAGWLGLERRGARGEREAAGHYQPVPNMFAWIKP